MKISSKEQHIKIKSSNMKSVLLILLILIISTLFLQSLIAAPPEPTGRRLKEIMEDKYPFGDIIIGGTTGQQMFGTDTGAILDREFNYVTPENDFKQPQIHPNNTTWTWTKPDAWVSHIASNNQILRMHGPISPQASNWAKDDSRTAEELETNMRDFMTALCQRFNGTPGFKYLDVVNETVINGQWHKNKPGTPWEVPWFIIGQDTDANQTPLYIKYAFQIATQYATEVKLIYNQHETSIIPASWDLIKETIAYLRNQGLRVDGIGWQAHVDTSWETVAGQTDALRDLIDWAHQNNLEFHITENSVWLKNGNTQSELEKQAATYRAIIDILLEKCSQGKVGWNTWHISDGTTSSHPEWLPSLFDANYEPKPAYYAVQAALEDGAPISGTPTPTPAPTLTPAPTEVPTPTPTPGTGEIYIEYRCTTKAAVSQRVDPHLIMYNISASNIPLTELTIRYWYTSEVGSNEVCELDYIEIGPENITTQFIGTGTDHCIEIGFTSGAGNLSAYSDTGIMQIRIHDSDYRGDYDQSDDYSFDPAITEFTQYDRVTIYHNGGLIWGVEQNPGSTPAPTETPTPTPTPTPEATPVPGTLGDVNNDTVINIIDALVTAQYYVGLNPENFNSDNADVDCSGNVNIVDALIIAQFYVGLISQFC